MDCSKTINFFAEAKRLCDSRTGCTADVANKEQCPLFAFCKHPSITRGAEYAKKLIENLQKWSDEHPKKTYAQDFFEKFPNAQNYAGVNPVVCRKKSTVDSRTAIARNLAINAGTSQWRMNKHRKEINKMKIVLDDGAFKPYKAHPEDAGFDIMARECRIPQEQERT